MITYVTSDKLYEHSLGRLHKLRKKLRDERRDLARLKREVYTRSKREKKLLCKIREAVAEDSRLRPAKGE